MLPDHAMTLRLPDDLYQWLRRQAYEEDTNKTQIVIRALRAAQANASE